MLSARGRTTREGGLRKRRRESLVYVTLLANGAPKSLEQNSTASPPVSTLYSICSRCPTDGVRQVVRAKAAANLFHPGKKLDHRAIMRSRQSTVTILPAKIPRKYFGSMPEARIGKVNGF